MRKLTNVLLTASVSLLTFYNDGEIIKVNLNHSKNIF